MYTNNSYIIPNCLHLKKIKWNLDILAQSWELILSNSNWRYNVISPTNESTHNWPITEWIHCDELLFKTIYQCYQLTDIFSFHNYNDRLELEWAWKITVEPSSSFYDKVRASRAELEPSLNTRSSSRIAYSWPGCCHGQIIPLLQVLVSLF